MFIPLNLRVALGYLASVFSAAYFCIACHTYALSMTSVCPSVYPSVMFHMVQQTLEMGA